MAKKKSLFRTKNKRLPKQKFIVFCEGRNTEPQYIEALKSKLKGTIIDIEIVKGAGAPLTIADLAVDKIREIKRENKRSKQSFGQNDQVWVVFDRDDHPNVPQALQKCKSAGVGIAYSNPCFELWLILHRVDYDKSCNRHEIQKFLKKLCPEYDYNSGKSLDCFSLVEKVQDAEDRAEKQIKRRSQEGSVSGCPSTTVYNLTRMLHIADKGFKR